MKFCFHDWSIWSKPLDTAHDYHKVQVRYCNKCNKCHVKKIKQPWNVWFSAKALELRSQS
jgi:hypothetical protein